MLEPERRRIDFLGSVSGSLSLFKAIPGMLIIKEKVA